MAIRIVACMTLGCAVVGGFVDTLLIRKIILTFLLVGNISAAYSTMLLFVGVILPCFVSFGLYSKRRLNK